MSKKKKTFGSKGAFFVWSIIICALIGTKKGVPLPDFFGGREEYFFPRKEGLYMFVLLLERI